MEIFNYLSFFKKRNLFYKLILWKFRVYLNFAYFYGRITTLFLLLYILVQDKAIVVKVLIGFLAWFDRILSL